MISLELRLAAGNLRLATALKALDSLTGKVALNDVEKKAAQVAIKGLVENRARTVLAVSGALQKLINAVL